MRPALPAVLRADPVPGCEENRKPRGAELRLPLAIVTSMCMGGIAESYPTSASADREPYRGLIPSVVPYIGPTLGPIRRSMALLANVS